jgi:hypothetical protein
MTGLPFWATLSALCAGGIRAEMLNRPAPINNTRADRLVEVFE